MGSSSLDAGLLAGEFPSLFRVVLVVWMATFGGCVGSFLNVVVYRLPRGMSLVHPGSHCPSCQCPIRWYHNIPVFAWITLGGRCHNCSARISVRYPLVEAVSAGLFAAVAWTGPLAVGGGAAGPTPVAVGWGAMAAWWLCGYHLILLSGLLVLALIENDGHPGAGVGFPWRSYVGLALVGWIAPPIWATVAWSSGPLVPADHRLPASVLVAAVVVYARNSLISACGAALLSLAACPATALGPARERGRLFAGGNLLLVGLFLGAEAVFALATATAGVFLAATCLPQFLPRCQTHSVRPTWSLILFALTVSWLVIWRPWFVWQPFCGAWQTVLIGAGLLVACGLLSLGTRAIIR